MEPSYEGEVAGIESKPARYMRIAWLVIEYVFDRTVDMLAVNVALMRREGDLFFGTVLTIIGFFSFQSGKYCDGNATDYLSCTRPSTYYYYGGWEIFLILLGVFFLLFWVLKRQRQD